LSQTDETTLPLNLPNIGFARRILTIRIAGRPCRVFPKAKFKSCAKALVACCTTLPIVKNAFL